MRSIPYSLAALAVLALGVSAPARAQNELGYDPEADPFALLADARASYADIGAVVSLSAPAVKRRVDRLRAAGVIRGFTAVVDPAAMGWTTEAFVELYCTGRTTPSQIAEAARRRTFAIISHPDAGKTTLTEKFLLYGGAVQEAGWIRAGVPVWAGREGRGEGGARGRAEGASRWAGGGRGRAAEARTSARARGARGKRSRRHRAAAARTGAVR